MPPYQNERPYYPLNRGPHEFIEDQVELTPDAPALSMGPESISYRELNSRANRLAHFLAAHGTGPAVRVGVYLDRSLQSVITLLAILKCGGVYLPLDPKFPKDRLEFMATDAEIPLLLAHSTRRDSLPRTAARVILLDQESTSIGQQSAANLDFNGEPDQTAYLIYTSGSTGKPKGVMIPRRALANFLLSMTEAPGIDPSDILLSVTPSSFDISILEFLLPLVRGAQIVMASAVQAGDGRELQHLLRQSAATVMQATPATWRMLLESGWEGKSDLRILCGGEALTQDLARQLLPRCKALWNMYGPTETTIWSSVDHVTSADHISLGLPIANTQFHVLDENRKPVSAGEPGELWIGGTGLAQGYLKRPELTAERFVSDPTSNSDNSNARLYRTGDEVRYRPDGSLEFLGRLDHQVKLNGFRIELGEIECALTNIDGITQVAVILREDQPGDRRLVAYYTGRENLSSTLLVESLKTTLPDYMVPAAFMHLERFPLTPNSKLDRKALPQPARTRPLLAQEFIAPQTPVEKQLAALWRELLQLDEIGIDDSFFDLGGNSLAAVRMVRQYHARFGHEIPAVKVFQHPTIARLAALLEVNESGARLGLKAENEAHTSRLPNRSSKNESDDYRDAIAVVGLSGRFPGASNPDLLWRNLCNSVESISFFSPEELGPGIDESLRNDPNYIRARGIIEGADLFDAAFFGIGPLEAKVIDPQQRVFLELADHALENAGYDPERYQGRIGVFAGSGDNHYYTTNLLTHPDLLAMAGKLAVEYGNEKDYIALRTAYLLDLRGPAVSLNTACSTTLLAVDYAYRSLREHECDIALAGGIDITIPQKSGFLYQEGGVFAKDGHCRPFDAGATGTMFCDGAGVVVLKRLSDALTDGDTVYCLVRGSGKNNNGSRPASFLAPSMEGQAEVIDIAQQDANVPIESIRYIEAHGTGTPVGDPIEFEALRTVFERKTNKKQFCYIGSIKGNIGHPTNAAGVVGLIKAAFVLHHELIPPTLHFKTPNPRMELEDSPFIFADKLIPFPRGEEVRRTAVSSFGFGGTNVHVILEEAPLPKGARPSRPRQLLLLSAKSTAALNSYSSSLVEHFQGAPSENFADTAYTFQVGRRQMAHRRFVVAADPHQAAKLLAHPNPLRCGSKSCERRNPPIVFLFGGQGTQYVNMGRSLYRDEPLFRAVIDDCCDTLTALLGRDLRELLFPRVGDEKTAQVSLVDTLYTQPSIFVIEYALARYWQSLGVEPATMVGHSIGEFVAATLADVWELEDALRIVALRGQLMHDLPRGSMMAVNSSAESIAKTLPATLQIASINAPGLCVISGPEQAVREFQKQLEAQDAVCHHLHTSHAFHSAMIDPIIEPLRHAIAEINLRGPAKPFVSTVTGEPITAAETTDPSYWARHARSTVQFGKAIHYLKEHGYDLFLECGPRSTMCSLARQQFTPSHPCVALPTLADTAENETEWETLLFALGSLWQNGVPISWDGFYTHEDRQRIPLPTYPFERMRFWVDAAPTTADAQGQPAGSKFIDASFEHAVEPLSVPASQESYSSEAVSAPRRDTIAWRLIDLLIAVSGRDRSQIDPSSTFMEQGFDSLSLTQVAFAIRKELSVKVTFSQLMNQFPNVNMLSEYIDAILPAGLLAGSSAIVVDQENQSLPSAPLSSNAVTNGGFEGAAAQAETITRLVALLKDEGVNLPATLAAAAESAAAQLSVTPKTGSSKQATTAPVLFEAEATIPQRGIFISSCLSQNLSASYNESVTLRFTGNISVENMTRAIERLVERHDALRANFDETGRMMKINPSLRVQMPVTDLSAFRAAVIGVDKQEELLRNLILEETALPFSLPDGPVFRCQMILLDQNCAAVILTAHHIICDGWSLDVLIHDLCAFYSAEMSDAPESFEPAESFLGYVQDVTARQRSEGFRRASSYWHAKFKDGFPVLVLPADHAAGGRREFKARRTDYPVHASVTQDLKTLAAQEGCSFFAVLLSSLAIFFARVAHQRRFVIALPTAEQPVSGQPGLVGQCVNLIPFAVDLRDGENVRSFLKRVQSDLLAAQENAVYTMVSLLEDLHPVAHTRGISPISAGFTNARKFKFSELPQSGFTVDYDANPKNNESFEIYLNAVESDEGLDLHCHYDIKLFEDITIREWLAALDSIFQDVAANPSRDVLSVARLDNEAAPANEILYSRIFEREVARQDNQNSSIFASEFSSDKSELRDGSERSEAELLQALIPLWRRVLDIREFGPDDEFFALGGHSIAAAQLFALIKSELGYSAPLSVLYDASTPRLLAKVLVRGTREEDWKALVPINRNGNRPPLFLPHAAEGNVLLYRSLAAHLGNDQPVYGLQSAGLDGRSPVDARFEHVARNYIDEIRRIQPHGPYMLGGYCLGGTIAIEMARQLIGAGETVGMVALIEDYNVRAMRWPLARRHVWINRFFLNPLFHLQNMLAAEGTAKFDFFMDKLGVEIRRAKVPIRAAWYALRHRSSPDSISAMRRAKLADIYEDALTSYNVQPYPGELTLFIAQRHLAGFDVPLAGWAEIAKGGLRLYSLPISPRGSLIEPYVRQLASILRSCLDQAIEQPPINLNGKIFDQVHTEASFDESKVEAHT